MTPPGSGTAHPLEEGGWKCDVMLRLDGCGTGIVFIEWMIGLLARYREQQQRGLVVSTWIAV